MSRFFLVPVIFTVVRVALAPEGQNGLNLGPFGCPPTIVITMMQPWQFLVVQGRSDMRDHFLLWT